MEKKGLLKGREVAEILSVSRALAYRLMANGEIPTVRFGRTVRVRPEDLEGFISNNLLPGRSGSIYPNTQGRM